MPIPELVCVCVCVCGSGNKITTKKAYTQHGIFLQYYIRASGALQKNVAKHTRVQVKTGHVHMRPNVSKTTIQTYTQTNIIRKCKGKK